MRPDDNDITHSKGTAEHISHIAGKTAQTSGTDKQTRGKNMCEKKKTEQCGKAVCGSLTAEASLAFPIFLFALLALISIFRFIDAEYKMEHALFCAARKVTSFGSLADVADDLFPDAEGIAGRIVDETVVGTAVIEELPPDVLELVEDGIWGLSFSGSELFCDDRIRIDCNYTLRVPFVFFGEFLGIPVSHSVTYRYFNGHDVPLALTEADDQGESDEEDDPGNVYVTETGSVYHVCKSCSSINISKRELIYGSLEGARNSSGGKYKPCEKCAKGDPPAVIYVTNNGDRFHYLKDCSALKRTVTVIKKQEALEKGYRACKKCAGKE